MLKMIRQLFALLTPRQVRQFYVLQLLVIFMAFFELIGIASIAPFMALVGDISLIEKNTVLAELYQLSGLSEPLDFVFYTGLAVLVTLTLSTLISMYTIWKLSLYAARVGTELADRLYAHYMQQNWLYHASTSSSHLTKQIATETTRVTNHVVRQLLQMNAKLMLSLFIAIAIFIYDPIIALSGLLVFAGAYLFLYKIVRKRLQSNGQLMSQVMTQRFLLMNEGFGGIKDALLLNRAENFVDRFQKSGKTFAYATGTNNAIALVPRYFMELVAFGTMLGLVLLLIKTHKSDLGAVLPILAVYALAGFKLLPALQQVYGSLVEIKGNIAAFEAIRTDLMHSSHSQSVNNKDAALASLQPKNTIELKDITFTYPGKSEPAVDGLTMSIPANSTVGLVGASGSGKSTTIDLFLGLLTPDSGQLCVDDTCITPENNRVWQNSLGFVPQNIFLSEGTIAENVAFGLPSKHIDKDKVRKALKLANLSELVAQLAEGLDTKVGERGIQLSGGQRQRIGIARALYNEANILVFDEATSALDGITEKIIMQAIHEFSGKKTIVMIAHRLKTVETCDIIYLMENGKIADQGTYTQLLASSSNFRKMAEHA